MLYLYTERVIFIKKILVVLTGGTIGSRVEKEKIDVTASSALYLLERYKEVYGSDAEFEVMQPFSILSENMNLDFLNRYARVMWEIPYQDFAGVILTHGSDTLSYTSALLGMLLCHVPVPVVLTAADYPLEDKRSNGLANFRSAVELIKTRFLKGVFTVYRNRKGENNVYLATRITEADAYLDQFGSFGGIPLGKIEDGSFRYYDEAPNPALSQLACKRTAITGSCPVFEKTVLMMKAYPGLDYRAIDLSAKPAAVLHILYHSGTACTEGKNSSLLEFMERCKRSGIPVYTASGKQAGGRNYVTAKAVLEKGAVQLFNISPEAAYAKLLLLYHIGDGKEVSRRIGETIYFENLPFPEKESKITKK